MPKMSKFESVPNANTLSSQIPLRSLSLSLSPSARQLTHRIILALLCNHHYSALIEASALNRYCQIAQCLSKTEQVICGKHSSLSICRGYLGCPMLFTNLDHNQSYQRATCSAGMSGMVPRNCDRG